MGLIAARINGMEDITPAESYKWQTIEKLSAETAETYGFRQIRIPTFEKTDLFVRSVGDTTDVVQKEMFTVKGRESSFTLRPEGTAGTIRSIIENGLLNEALPQKVYYILSCFRHEKPEAGRLWEFHQFGAELVGSVSPSADAEVIGLARTLIDRFGLTDAELNINSIGCPKCRSEYYRNLRSFFEPHRKELCPTCQSRLEKNPMRIIDCKSDICKNIAADAPMITDNLCEDCAAHFEELKKLLDAMDIKYTVNPKIVRGLDYYTRTVFEFIAGDGKQRGTVCGGGRYDGLVEELGGKPTPALGFAIGLERILLNLKQRGITIGEPKRCDIYIAPMGEKAAVKVSSIAKKLRDEGFLTETDLMNRAFGKQLKYAQKINARYFLVIGDNELESGKAKLKNMDARTETEITLSDNFTDSFSNIYMADMFENALS